MGVHSLKVRRYAMLRPSKAETALFGCQCLGDKFVRMRPMMATLQEGVSACHHTYSHANLRYRNIKHY